MCPLWSIATEYFKITILCILSLIFSFHFLIVTFCIQRFPLTFIFWRVVKFSSPTLYFSDVICLSSPWNKMKSSIWQYKWVEKNGNKRTVRSSCLTNPLKNMLQYSQIHSCYHVLNMCGPSRLAIPLCNFMLCINCALSWTIRLYLVILALVTSRMDDCNLLFMMSWQDGCVIQW